MGLNGVIEHAESIVITRKPSLQTRHNIHRTSKLQELTRLVISDLAYQAAQTHWEQKVAFDTDSFKIGIDNRCSAYISSELLDFIGPLKDSN